MSTRGGRQRQLFTVAGELGATDPVNLYAGDKVSYVVEDLGVDFRDMKAAATDMDLIKIKRRR